MIWFVVTDDMPVLALMIYGKNEQANPNAAQRQAMLAAVEALLRGGKHEGGENG